MTTQGPQRPGWLSWRVRRGSRGTSAARLHTRAEATMGTAAGLCAEPAPLGRAGRASPPSFPQLAEGHEGRASWDVAVSALEKPLWGLKSFIWASGARLSLYFLWQQKGRPWERLPHRATEGRKAEEKRHALDAGEFSGPERSLLGVIGGFATATAWKWERWEAGGACGRVCGALTGRVSRAQRPTGAGRGPEPLLAASCSEAVSSGGGVETAENSHGLWDLLFSRNQWN